MTLEHRRAFREAVRQAQLGDWLDDYRGTWIEKIHQDAQPQTTPTAHVLTVSNKPL